MRFLAMLVLAMMLAGCASMPGGSAKVRDGEASRLNRECKLLGTVTGRSLLGGMADNARGEAAMADARDKAAAMGATDLYFLNVDTTGILNTAQATARVFRCDAPQ
jgi:hypothetical protein